MSEKQGSVLGPGHGDNHAVTWPTAYNKPFSASQISEWFYSLNVSKCVFGILLNSNRCISKGTGCKAVHLRSRNPPAPRQSCIYVRKNWVWEREYTAHFSQVPSLDGSLSSPVVNDLWSCSLPGPSGPTDGYVPYGDERTCDTQTSYSRKFSQKSTRSLRLSVKEKYPAESSFLSGKGNCDLYAF